MALDTRYVPTKYFQEIFLDKDTGCPLSGGVVKFYRDNARTTPKEVYQLTGTPPNYTYISLGTEVTLSSSGTFQDGSSNDITVYLFPYDTSGNIDLYYATVESSGAVSQFTREGFPNVSQEDIEDEELLNFIPNGQFLLHHDIVEDEDGGIEEGEITDDVTDIAEGGWSFERTPSTAAKDFVLFERLGSFVETPSKSPRYVLNVKNEAPGVADTYKDVRIKFRDVNKFASDTEKYTFSFQAKSNSGSNQIEVKLIKNYGTGGSAEETTVLEVINLTGTYQIYDIPFEFGDNDGKTIGDEDDDFSQLVISLPVSSAFDNTFVNFGLFKGDKQIEEFPDTTDAEFIRDSLAGWPPIPNYEGENLYLPVRLGLKGFEYDTGEIGRYVLKSTEDLEIGELWCDGEKYRVEAYSSDKIPYRRLYEKWSINSDYGLAIYGTGDDEMYYLAKPAQDQSFATSDTNSNINNDSWQSFTPAVTGNLTSITVDMGTPAPASHSTITIHEGEGTTGAILARETGINLITGSNTINIGRIPVLTSGLKYTIRIQNAGNVYWRTNAAGGYAGGSYNGTAADAVFYTFMLNALSSAQYRLSSTTAGAVVAAADGAVPTGFTFTAVQPDPYIIDITAVAASGMTAGSYWTYNTTDSRKNIVWYEIDGSGTKPTETAVVYHKISILSTDNAATVNNKTSLVVNGYSIKIPDWRSYFIRAFDRQIGTDPDTHLRTDRGDSITSNALGTLQIDEFKSHTHLAGVAGLKDGSPESCLTNVSNSHATSATGGLETRPINRTVNIAVKY